MPISATFVPTEETKTYQKFSQVDKSGVALGFKDAIGGVHTIYLPLDGLTADLAGGFTMTLIPRG